MSDPITLGGTDYRPAVILIPIRLRLRSAYPTPSERARARRGEPYAPT
jgi:hypothetical protein